MTRWMVRQLVERLVRAGGRSKNYASGSEVHKLLKEFEADPDQRLIPREQLPEPELPSGSAEQGDADAQCQLGYMYVNGEGVPENEAEAVKW
mgnify:CR=1 FL=1